MLNERGVYQSSHTPTSIPHHTIPHHPHQVEAVLRELEPNGKLGRVELEDTRPLMRQGSGVDFRRFGC